MNRHRGIAELRLIAHIDSHSKRADRERTSRRRGRGSIRYLDKYPGIASGRTSNGGPYIVAAVHHNGLQIACSRIDACGRCRAGNHGVRSGPGGSDDEAGRLHAGR
jgi:hypothetical protein